MSRRSMREKSPCVDCILIYKMFWENYIFTGSGVLLFHASMKSMLLEPWHYTIINNRKESRMYSDDEKVVLCGASAYEQKYYFNQDFASLPQNVQDELHVMCVMFTVEIGGIFTLWFDGEGNLQFETEAVDADAMYDEIGGALRIKQLQQEKRELLESLELYYRVFFLGEEVPEDGESGL